MSEPIIQRLSQFTPDGSSLDRDALLFAAGRASVRPNRGWITTTLMLAACQVFTLALLWPPAAPPTGRLAETLTGWTPVEKPSLPPDASELVILNRRLLDSKDGELPPTGSTDDLVPAAPPLHAFASPTPAWLD
ncbi:MAG TPA: hypothetical protein VGG61_07950 [Gemmataceae bacterium]|jgi:hypothetical protein